MDNPVIKALQYLAGVCDYANKKDGQGFNMFDAEFGHSLANQTAAGVTLTDGQLSKALEMLRKYQKQLESTGIVLPSDKMTIDKRPKVELNGSMIYITFQGKPSPDMLELVKGLPERRWQPNLPGMPWSIPAKYWQTVIKAFGEKANISQSVYDLSSKPAVETPEVPQVQTPSTGFALDYDGKNITVKFGGKPDPDTLAKIKALPERKWMPDDPGKPWIIPIRYAADIIKMFPTARVSQKLTDLAKGQSELSEMSRKSSSDFDVPGLKLPLLPFQRAGVEFLEKANGRAILGDSMGLGKTPQTLAYLQLHPEMRPAIIVVPASLKINWQREITRFMSTDDRVSILSGTKAHDLDLIGASIYIINYDILESWLDKIIVAKPQVVVYDEAHYMKNRKSIRNHAGKKLSKVTPKTICLTGTPITNRPAELWPLLNMVDPVAWPNFFKFAQHYCNASQTGFGWDFNGASNLDDLHERIKPWMVRRQKSEVLKELPDKRHATVVIEFDERQRQNYNAVLSGAINVIRNTQASHNPVNVLAEIERAKQATIYGKLTAAIAWVENFLDTNGKLVVFCTHQFVVDALMEHFGEIAVKVTGEITGQQRQDAVDKFQNDDTCRLFVGNIKAAGVGLTLTAASDVAFIEYPWTPGDLTQAIDRTHRIGQTESVTVWYLVADGTIEEEIVNLLQAKAQIIGQAIDGNAQAMDVNILGELVKSLEGWKGTI